jgi:ABC-2 type transport system permease protein
LAYNAIIPPFKLGDRQLNYIAFLAPGAVLIQIIAMSSLGGVMFWTDKYNGMLEQLFSFPFPRSYYFLARIFALLIPSVATGLAILLISLPLLGDAIVFQLYSIPLLLGSLAACSLMYGFLSMLISSFVKTPDRVTVFTRLLTTPTILVSAVFYPIQYAPSPIKEIGYLNPLTYCAELLRASLFGTLSSVNLYGSIALLAITLIVIIATRVVFEKIQI